MSWYQTITRTLEAMEALTNPSSEAELKRLTQLGEELQRITAQVPRLSEAERAEAKPHLPALGSRIESVITRLEATRQQTAESLTGLRSRAQAAAAYKKR